MKIPLGMAEVLEGDNTYEGILKLIKSIYSLVQASRCWFKEYTNTVTPKSMLKKFKTDTCLLYRLDELGTDIFIIYANDTLAIGENQH